MGIERPLCIGYGGMEVWVYGGMRGHLGVCGERVGRE